MFYKNILSFIIVQFYLVGVWGEAHAYTSDTRSQVVQKIPDTLATPSLFAPHNIEAEVNALTSQALGAQSRKKKEISSKKKVNIKRSPKTRYQRGQVRSFAVINATQKVFFIILLFAAYWLITVSAWAPLGLLIVAALLLTPILASMVVKDKDIFAGFLIVVGLIVLGTGFALLPTVLPYIGMLIVAIGVIYYLQYMKTSHLIGESQAVNQDGLYEYSKKESLYESLAEPKDPMIPAISLIIEALLGAILLVGIHLFPIATLVAVVILGAILALGRSKDLSKIKKVYLVLAGICLLATVAVVMIPGVSLLWLLPPATGALTFLLGYIRVKGSEKFISDDLKKESEQLIDEALDINRRLPTGQERRLELIRTNIYRTLFNLVLIATVVWSLVALNWIAFLIILGAASMSFLAVQDQAKYIYGFMLVGAIAFGIVAAILLPMSYLMVAGAVFALTVLFWINHKDRDSSLEVNSNSHQIDALTSAMLRDGRRDFSKQPGKSYFAVRTAVTWENLLVAFLIAGVIWAINASLSWGLIPILFFVLLLAWEKVSNSQISMFYLLLVPASLIILGVGAVLASPVTIFIGITLFAMGGLFYVYDRQMGGQVTDPKEHPDNPLNNHLFFRVFRDGIREGQTTSGRLVAMGLIAGVILMGTLYWAMASTALTWMGFSVMPLVILVFILLFLPLLDRDQQARKAMKDYDKILLLFGAFVLIVGVIVSIDILMLMGGALLATALLYIVYRMKRDPDLKMDNKFKELQEYKPKGVVNRELVDIIDKPEKDNPSLQKVQHVIRGANRKALEHLQHKYRINSQEVEAYKDWGHHFPITEDSLVFAGEIGPIIVEGKKQRTFRFLPALGNGRISLNGDNPEHYVAGQEFVIGADDLSKKRVLYHDFWKGWFKLNHFKATEEQMKEYLLMWFKREAKYLQEIGDSKDYGQGLVFAGNIKGQVGEFILEGHENINAIQKAVHRRADKGGELEPPQSFYMSQVQFNPHTGEPVLNAIRMIQKMRELRYDKEKPSDIIIFGELSLTGYAVADLFNDPHFMEDVVIAQQMVRDAAKKMGVAVRLSMPVQNKRKTEVTGGKSKAIGLWTYVPKGHAKMRAYEHTQYKVLLPTYNEMNEFRWFNPGEQDDLNIPVVDLIKPEYTSESYKNWACEICEDGWNGVTVDPDERIYPNNPTEFAYKNGAQILFNHSASPYYLGKFRKATVPTFTDISRFYNQPMFFTNIVGEENGVFFDGQSMVINSQGEIVSLLKAFEEDAVTFDLNRIDKMTPVSKKELDEKFAWDHKQGVEENPWDEMLPFSRQHIRDYAHKRGMWKNPSLKVSLSKKDLGFFAQSKLVKKYIDNVEHRYNNARKGFVMEFDGSPNAVLAAKLLGNALKGEVSLVAVLHMDGISDRLKMYQKRFLINLGFRIIDNIYENLRMETMKLAKSGFVRVSTYSMNEFLLGSHDDDNKAWPLLASFTDTQIRDFLDYFDKTTQSGQLPYLRLDSKIKVLFSELTDHVLECMMRHSNRGYQSIISKSYEKSMEILKELSTLVIEVKDDSPFARFKDSLNTLEKCEDVYVRLIQKLVRDIEATEGLRNRFNSVQYTKNSSTLHNRPLGDLWMVDPDLRILDEFRSYKKKLEAENDLQILRRVSQAFDISRGTSTPTNYAA